MPARLTWLNNSQGHEGTSVHRSSFPMDPTSLPAPIGVANPVPQGEQAEFIDHEDLPAGKYYYRTRDYQAGDQSEASSEVLLDTSIPAPAIGEPFEGGYFAGTITYADSRQYHLVVADVEADLSPSDTDNKIWGIRGVLTNANDRDDGKANQDLIISRGEEAGTAFQNAMNYLGGGFNDWYIPAINEFYLIRSNLAVDNTAAPLFQAGGAQAFRNSGADRGRYWSSSEVEGADTAALIIEMYSAEVEIVRGKDDATWVSQRPIRRVPA